MDFIFIQELHLTQSNCMIILYNYYIIEIYTVLQSEEVKFVILFGKHFFSIIEL